MLPIIIAEMEESANEKDSETDETEDTLLSYKIGKMSSSPPIKALISKLICKQQNRNNPNSLS
jgi:hypothetical protein